MRSNGRALNRETDRQPQPIAANEAPPSGFTERSVYNARITRTAT